LEAPITKPTFFPSPRTLGTLCLVVLLVAVQAPAEARRQPKQSGPINFDERQCARKTIRWRNPKTGVREIVAKTETCALSYDYDPLREDNENRNFGILWAQARIDPRGAWCAKKVWSDIVVSEDTRMHKRTPAKNYDLSRSRKILVKLSSTADGAGDGKATVQETTTFRPKKLRHSRFTFERQPVFRQVWTGQRGGVFHLTSGVEVSWAEDDPPDGLSSGVLGNFERRGRC
jgi:hypothetical protein